MYLLPCPLSEADVILLRDTQSRTEILCPPFERPATRLLHSISLMKDTSGQNRRECQADNEAGFVFFSHKANSLQLNPDATTRRIGSRKMGVVFLIRRACSSVVSI